MSKLPLTLSGGVLTQSNPKANSQQTATLRRRRNYQRWF